MVCRRQKFGIDEREIVNGAIKHHRFRQGEIDLTNILNPGCHTDWDDIDESKDVFKVLPIENAPDMNPYCY